MYPLKLHQNCLNATSSCICPIVSSFKWLHLCASMVLRHYLPVFIWVLANVWWKSAISILKRQITLGLFQPITGQLCSKDCREELWLVERLWGPEMCTFWIVTWKYVRLRWSSQLMTALEKIRWSIEKTNDHTWITFSDLPKDFLRNGQGTPLNYFFWK